jgi:hypothetical protein
LYFLLLQQEDLGLTITTSNSISTSVSPLITQSAEELKISEHVNEDISSAASDSEPVLKERRASIVLQNAPTITSASKTSSIPYPTSPKGRIKVCVYTIFLEIIMIFFFFFIIYLENV